MCGKFVNFKKYCSFVKIILMDIYIFENYIGAKDQFEFIYLHLSREKTCCSSKTKESRSDAG